MVKVRGERMFFPGGGPSFEREGGRDSRNPLDVLLGVQTYDVHSGLPVEQATEALRALADMPNCRVTLEPQDAHTVDFALRLERRLWAAVYAVGTLTGREDGTTAAHVTQRFSGDVLLLYAPGVVGPLVALLALNGFAALVGAVVSAVVLWPVLLTVHHFVTGDDWAVLQRALVHTLDPDPHQPNPLLGGKTKHKATPPDDAVPPASGPH